MSVRPSISSLLYTNHCSGEQYPGVPPICPSDVTAVSSRDLLSTAFPFTSPQSAILIPDFVSSMNIILSGFKSLW